jgi:hypothetical protein
MCRWIFLLLLPLVGGCVSGSYYGAGTLIGLNVGTPEGIGFTIGYQKYEAGFCGPRGRASVNLVEKMGPAGLDRGQVLTLGCPEGAQTASSDSQAAQVPTGELSLPVTELDWGHTPWEGE